MSAGTKIGDAFLQLRIDRAQAEKDARTSAQGLADIFRNAFVGMELGKVIKGSIDNAMDLNAQLGKVKTVFGENSDAVVKFGQDAAKNFGLSEQAALRTTGALGNLLQNLGFTREQSVQLSQQLTQVAADVGAAFNKDTADVLDVLTKGVAGQTRGLKAYGVVLNDVALKQEAQKEGLYSGRGALDAHAKAAASLALILQQTSKFQGDFAASTDTAATSQRIAKAETENASASLGQNFLPIYQKIVTVVGAAATVFAALPGPIQVGVVALAALVSLSGPIGTVVAVVEDLAVAFSAAEVSAAPFLGIAALIGAAIGAYVLFSGSQDLTAKHSADVADKLGQEADAIDKARQAAGGAVTVVQALADAQTALSKAIVDADANQQRLIQSLGALGLQTDDAAGLMLKLQGADQLYVDSIRGSTPEIRNRAKEQLALIGVMLQQKGISADVAAAVVAEAGSLAAGKGGTIDFAAATKGLTAEQMVLVNALLNVGKSASQINVNQIAADYLKTQAATNKFNESLVEQAEAQAGTTRNSADAIKVYDQYRTIVAQLTPEQRASGGAAQEQATGIEDVTAAVDAGTPAFDNYNAAQDQLKANEKANKDATSELSKAIKDSSNEFDRAKSAADTFSKALDAVFSPSLNLEDANRKLQKSIDDVAASFKKNGNTLDINTEKGRNNRQAIEDHVKAILDQTKANVASGTSVKDATAAAEVYRQQLINTSGSTKQARAAAEEYINELGLTPDNITTAVHLDHDEEVKKSLEGLLTQLGDIPANKATEIQALIDQGEYDKAAAALDALAHSRPVLFVPSGNFVSGNVAGPQHGVSAAGRFVPGGSNFLTTTGERPGTQGDEIILPLGDPGRMHELLGLPGVGDRVLAAVGGGGSTTAVQIDKAYFSSGMDAEQIAQIVLFKLGVAQ